MDVSIIIVNYNTFELTRNCIQSIRYQQAASNLNYEIILVDNASDERNPEEFKQLFPFITLIKSDKNVGFAAGNNLGIEQAKGDAILLLNSDTILENDAISICYNYLKGHNEVAVVTGKLKYPNGDVQSNCQRFPSIKYRLFEILRLPKILRSKAGHILFGFFFDYNTLAFPDWVWGTFFMFQRRIIEQLPEKKLSDLFFMYGEDMQWCMEFRLLGYEICFLPEAKIIHLMGASGGAKSELIKQNLQVFMNLYYSSWKRIVIKLLNLLLVGRYEF